MKTTRRQAREAMTDAEWFVAVERLATDEPNNGNFASSTEYANCWQEVIDYLWKDKDAQTYRRLADTPHGRFVRELAAPSPDYILRKLFREEIKKVGQKP